MEAVKRQWCSEEAAAEGVHLHQPHHTCQAWCVPLPSIWLIRCLGFVCSAAFVCGSNGAFGLCAPLPSWLRLRMCLCASAVVRGAETVPFLAVFNCLSLRRFTSFP